MEIVDKRTNEKRVYLKRAGWRQIALAYHLSDEIVKEEELSDPNNPEVYGYKIWVRVFRGSKSVVGTAMCWSNEPNKSFPHGKHDCYATAFTRALNRGISDYVGSGEVSFEEVSIESDEPPKAPIISQDCSCSHSKAEHFNQSNKTHCAECIENKTDGRCSLSRW